MLLVLLLAVVAAYGYREIKRGRFATHAPTAAPAADSVTSAQEKKDSRYACNGRTRCPQMHSCEEATFFSQHCPNTQMDGDGDGVPCEQQWCR
ncbi:DNA-binding protein [Lysobacter sp. TY2-98]|uniref:excalibur calcium-binding domain-containing protein n=1 Tax=Lysobacter sp. TY2-98 TaxID=2290922 RepID=UPI000E1FCB86|nr:excalibur calcium-binding domain-containing protein [Lysobacter sp. TY2-98]AXK71227.1 DNA-binding protein [Lysobacter sp. TY2-98]